MSQKRGFCNPVAHALHNHVKRTLARRNGTLGRLLMQWPDILEPQWAQVTEPLSLSKNGTLRIAVQSAASLQFHYYTGVLIEKINMHLGRPAVTKITTVQKTTLPTHDLPQRPKPQPAQVTAPPQDLEEALSRLEAALKKREK